jgi:hypothetical protein
MKRECLCMSAMRNYMLERKRERERERERERAREQKNKSYIMPSDLYFYRKAREDACKMRE